MGAVAQRAGVHQAHRPRVLAADRGKQRGGHVSRRGRGRGRRASSCKWRVILAEREARIHVPPPANSGPLSRRPRVSEQLVRQTNYSSPGQGPAVRQGRKRPVRWGAARTPAVGASHASRRSFAVEGGPKVGDEFAQPDLQGLSDSQRPPPAHAATIRPRPTAVSNASKEPSDGNAGDGGDGEWTHLHPRYVGWGPGGRRFKSCLPD